jgi:hypothetical protein
MADLAAEAADKICDLTDYNRGEVAAIIREEFAALTACVEFYARRDNHRAQWNGRMHEHDRAKAHDGGWKAREALGEDPEW